MKISRVTFKKAMRQIQDEQVRLNMWYDKLEECFGCIDTIIERTSIDPMINMLEMICDDSRHFISLYIFDAKWGNETCCFKDESGEKLPFKTIDDLYDVLDNLQPWTLEFCCGKYTKTNLM